MLIVCRLSNLCRLVPCHRYCSAADVAKLFQGFGLPESITSDRDTKFMSQMWTNLAEQLGIKLELTTSRHQNADGQAEIAIRTYKHPVSASTGHTPFFMALGFNPRVFLEEYVWSYG